MSDFGTTSLQCLEYKVSESELWVTELEVVVVKLMQKKRKKNKRSDLVGKIVRTLTLDLCNGAEEDDEELDSIAVQRGRELKKNLNRRT